MVSMDDLRRQVLFADLEHGELLKISHMVKEIALKKGDVLFKETDGTRGIYMVQKGKIEISKQTPDGWKQTLAVLASGSFFGELSIMERRSHEAGAVALENTGLLLLSKEDFERLESEDAVLALKITKKIAITMSKNLRGMNEKFIKALINY